MMTLRSAVLVGLGFCWACSGTAEVPSDSSGSGGGSSGGTVGASGGGPSGGAPSGGGPGAGGSSLGTGGARAGVQVCAVASTLKETAQCNNLLVGAALASSHINEGAYQTAAKEHSYMTPENEMKWQNVEPQQNQFNFGSADQLVSFAQQNGIKVKGHTLVWHNQLASWVNNLGTADAVRSAMNNHIQKVMEHYKGKILVWDVVNEAIKTDSDTGVGNPRYRSSPFYDRIGETYIEEAFVAAHDADPDAKLFYNDYSIEALNEKSDMVYEVLKDLVERGVPIDGVGFQAHIGKPNNALTAPDIVANFKRFAELGLEIQVSELDVNGCDGYSAADQEALYHDIVAACVAQPQCTAVTWWGITDKYSWLNSFADAGCNGQSARALPWDDNFQKKGIYTSIANALSGN